MTIPGPRFTYADYKLMPDDQRYELIEGELLVTPAPNARHQIVLFRLLLQIGNFVAAGRLGQVLPSPTDVVLAEECVVQPDILFVAEERRQIIDPTGGVQGAPDLVVEVLSPSTASRDRVVKRELYARFGVREYWIVDPDAGSIEVLVHSPGGLQAWGLFSDGSSLTSPLLDGLQVPLHEVFAE